MENSLAEQIDKHIKQIYDFADKHYKTKKRFSFEELRKQYYEKMKNPSNSR